MVYLFGSELPDNKSIFFSLRYAYGIGKGNSSSLCKKLGFSKNLKVRNLSKEHINKLIKIMEVLKIEVAGDLKKSKLFISKTLASIKSYRGLRKNQGLPVRGQRTHTNARTARKRKF
uniref:Ribosomal protein S13 n=1 Tax=Phaeodactylum tricornutum TaxID=2850 RepID=A0A6G7IW42_PHATR|nr:ribosomal protein S13 [Phaeodactylum tricornutum]